MSNDFELPFYFSEIFRLLINPLNLFRNPEVKMCYIKRYLSLREKAAKMERISQSVY